MNNSIRQEFKVPYNFDIVFTKHLFNEDNDLLRDFFNEYYNNDFKRKVLFLVDENVAHNHPYLENSIFNYFKSVRNISLVEKIIILPGGEEVKNDEKYLLNALDAINEHGIDRHSFLIAIGGGAFLDMAGYASCIAHRGIKHIRIPTTVLSQNDSGVGVKNSINFYGKKNFLGTFYPPVVVFNDSHFLTTLSDRDWISGISEAVKVALVKDYDFFIWLEENAKLMAERDMTSMSYQIFKSAQLHSNHISSGDPFEMGSARPLDFGHWSAHKLENLTCFEIRHGESVAIGIALDSVYSHLIGLISRSDLERIIALLKNLGFNIYHQRLSENNKLNLWKGLNEFREHLGGKLTITVLEKLGKGKEVHEIDYETMKSAVDFLEKSSLNK